MGKFFPNSLSWGGPADGSAALHHFGVMTQAQIDAFTPAVSPARVYNSDRDLEQDWNGATWENVNSAPEPVQVLSSANNGQTIAPGFYDINADAAFAVTLEAPLGQYQFANSRLNLSAANAVTINGNTPATDTFTDNAGAQVLGPLVLDIAGYGFRLVAESATDWHIVDAVILPPGNAPTAQQWVFSADNMTAAAGDQIIVQSGHTINLPANPTGPDEVLFVAANGDWETIGATFNTTDAFTIGAGQADIVVGADTVRMIAIAGNTNWLIASGGETAPPQDESYNAEADLPLASTVPPGRRAIVTNDADTSRIGVYVATGAVGAASASQWIKS